MCCQGSRRPEIFKRVPETDKMIAKSREIPSLPGVK
jgi:hypothetical protein